MNLQSHRRCAPVLVAAILVTSAAAKMASAQQNFKGLVKFGGTKGQSPAAELVQGLDGNLYGTTAGGGAHEGGTVFKITAKGMLTTVYNFCSQSGCGDGSLPNGLVQATDGNFYGTTYGGGNTACEGGCGTVFKITPAGALTTLYSFCAESNCTDGEQPLSGLTQGRDGNFYGTTSSGGAGNVQFYYCDPNACGTAFKITAAGQLTTLYSFCVQTNCPDGAIPLGNLVEAADGDFYGATRYGGTATSYGGTVFKLTTGGTLTTLYSFCAQTNCADGQGPNGGLVQGTIGNFYGTTVVGGAYNDAGCNAYCGTVFAMTPAGVLTTLHNFCAETNCADGDRPAAGLIQGTDGNFYGTTAGNLAEGPTLGTAFEITPEGSFTTLHAFDGYDGEEPAAGLLQATNGVFYGTTYFGGGTCLWPGALVCGTLFAVTTGLGPFVDMLPASGKAGARIQILGTNLTAASSVTFNGVAATFKVVSASEIETKVPSGATTGPVQVVTPGGTLTSNALFQVVQ